MLSCISMNNQKCIVRLQIVNVNDDDPVFFRIVLKQVNAVVVATISIIYSQNRVFLILQKSLTLKLSVQSSAKN